MRFSMGMLALFLVGITAAGFGAEKEMVIDCDHPGGNIIVEKIEGDDVSIRQDLRDTAGWWFYWSFRVRGAEGRTLNFRFGELEKSWHSVLGVRGPAVSLDRGQTWRWLGRETVTPTSFTYQFAADAGDVRFSFAMPYQESNLARFLEKHEGNPHLRREVLCQSRKGRPVEVLYLGCLSREPAFRLVFTCRHHACEMMASYALEGAMEEILSDTDVGKWLCENVEFLIVPFVDRDGVEDGDQGKQRKPWDHVCDYGEGREIYPETAAIKRLVPGWTGGKLVALMDLHCPGIRGRFHEVIMTPYRLRGADNWERAVEFLKFLDEVQHDGPLAFRLSDSQEFTTWTGPDGPKGANPCTFTTWARDLPGVEFAIAFEIPYANAGGQEVNQETARWFGHDLARAACQWLKSKAAVLAPAAAAGNGERALPGAGNSQTEPVAVDCDFPGGNIIVEKIEGDDVFIRQDLRDTSGRWFYWCFRVEGAQGRTLTFRFPDEGEKLWLSVLGVRGPAVSRDQGRTWEWLGRKEETPYSFAYSFAPDERDVRFSFAMPYQESDLRRFLDHHEGSPYLREEVLCQTRKGRPVERLHLGCLDREPEYRLLFTCRHHACEMMPNYVVEGLMEEILSDSDTGQWLHERVEVLVIPFVDKDGVEDGDQGKSRKPWDHVLDYHEEPIYPETAVVMDFLPRWSQGKLVMAVDLHCPGIRGKFSEVIMSPDRLRGPENWARAEEFFAVLESVQQGQLKFHLADSQEFTTWSGPDGRKGPTPRLFTTWVRTVPGILFGTALEVPYANAGGIEVNQMTARAFGHDLARALPVWLEPKVRSSRATERQAFETAE